MARFHRFSRLPVRLERLTLPVALACVFAAAASAQFGSEHLITAGGEDVTDVHAADLDGDGDLDVIASHLHDPPLTWHRNLGGGVFGSAIAFHSPDPFWFRSSEAVSTLDFDRDGDLDVVAALTYYHPTLGQNFEVEVYRNAGDASFTFAASYYLESSVAGLEVGDLEGDGDEDIFFGVWGDAVLVVTTHHGALALSSAVVTTEAFAPRDILPEDVDGDGDADLVVVSSTANSVTWFENTGGLPFGPEQVVSATATGAATVSAADLDGDADLDLVSGGSSSSVPYLRWYAQQGGRFDAHSITTGLYYPRSVRATDLDGDGDQDLLVGELFGVSWYANDGLGQFGPRQAIGGIVSGIGAEPADLDGDAVPDVLLGANPDFEGHIGWYPNLFTAPWTNLLSGLEGLLGIPSLVGTGTLETGSPGSLVLSAAAPSAPGLLVAALGSTPTPFKCGTLVPVPVLLGFPVLTGPAGSVPLAWSAWPNTPSGASLYLQYAIVDAAAPCGVSLSNALGADLP